MKLYLLKRTDSWGYDDYDSCVVCALNKADAIKITPDEEPISKNGLGTWVKSKGDIEITELGIANKSIERGLICASFHAG